MELKYFKISEFDSRDKEGSGVNMDKEFLELLDKLRMKVGRAFIVNSGYRTKSHNKAVGGSPNSSHLKGLAVDIHCPDSQFRYSVIKEAIKLGIDRIGIYKTFIHIDVDKSKVSEVMWNL